MTKTYEVIRPNQIAAIGEQFHAEAFDDKLKALGTLEDALKNGLVREVNTRATKTVLSEPEKAAAVKLAKK